MRQVAALFVRADSIYKTMPGVDAWDIERDARNWPGGSPVVAHPPCRAWSSMRHWAKPRPDEPALAPWAVDQVRRWGGVLKHPRGSLLWPTLNLPQPGQRDRWGFTFGIFQGWWGHRADKPTLLYIVGCQPRDVPDMPIRLGQAERVICPWSGFRKGMPGWRPHVRKDEREHTPPPLADWLVELARRCRVEEAAAA